MPGVDPPEASAPNPEPATIKEWALEKGRSAWADTPRWKKIALGAAGGMIALGLVIGAVELVGGGDPPAPTGTVPAGSAGLVPGQAPTGDAGVDAGGPTWSPAFLKMGFGFFVGFAAGFTLRAFLKLALLACGLLFLALFGLASAELITVEWQRMGEVFEGWVASLGEEIQGLQTLITGSLPATGLGAFGLYAGLRKR